MKRINLLTIIYLCLILASCSNYFEEESKVLSPLKETVSSKINLDEISLMVANNQIQTKGGQVSVEPVLEGEDTVLFLVNYPQGWSVMSADRRLPMNLITSDSGSITLNELMANESLESYIRAMMKEIKSMVANPIDMTQTKASNTPPMSFYDENGIWWVYSHKYVESSTINKQQMPLIKTKWGQGSTWNVNAPYTSSTRTSHCPTGCTNVAIAQLLYFLHNKTGVPVKSYRHFGTNAYYSEPNDTADGHILTSDEVSYYNFSDCWAEMPLNQNSASEAGAKLVSSLMVRLGYLFESGYKPDGTGTFRVKVKPALSSAFNISTTFSAYDKDIVGQQIYSSKNPVVLMMHGIKPSTQDTVGHTFLADGYRKLTENYTYVYKTMDETSTTYKYIQNAETYVNEYVSLNWGYDGSGDINNQGGVIWYNLDSSFSYQYSSGTVVYNMYKYMLFAN